MSHIRWARENLVTYQIGTCDLWYILVAIHVADQLGESDSYHIYQLGACDSCHRSVRRVCLMSYITWGHISKGHAIHATYQLVALNRVRDQLGACGSCHISVCRV